MSQFSHRNVQNLIRLNKYRINRINQGWLKEGSILVTNANKGPCQETHGELPALLNLMAKPCGAICNMDCELGVIYRW
jgi:hypothetical protein